VGAAIGALGRGALASGGSDLGGLLAGRRHRPGLRQQTFKFHNQAFGVFSSRASSHERGGGSGIVGEHTLFGSVSVSPAGQKRRVAAVMRIAPR